MAMKLRSREPQVGRQSGDVLQRSVVEVVSEPRKPFLACLDERALATRAAFEQHVALHQRREGRGRLVGEGERAVSLARKSSKHERCERPLEPGDAHAVHEAALKVLLRVRRQRQAGEGPDAPRRNTVAEAQHTLEPRRLRSRPKGDLRERRHHFEQLQLELHRDPRRKLEETRVVRGVEEDLRASFFVRDAAGVGRALDQALDVAGRPAAVERDRGQRVGGEEGETERLRRAGQAPHPERRRVDDPPKRSSFATVCSLEEGGAATLPLLPYTPLGSLVDVANTDKGLETHLAFNLLNAFWRGRTRYAAGTSTRVDPTAVGFGIGSPAEDGRRCYAAAGSSPRTTHA